MLAGRPHSERAAEQALMLRAHLPLQVLDFLVGWMLCDPACSLSTRNMAEAEIVDPRPVTHVAELAAQPRVCLQVGGLWWTVVQQCLAVGVQ